MVGMNNTRILSVSSGATSIDGEHKNHYDPLIPIREEVHMTKTFRETFYDKVEEDKNKCNWKAKYEANYIHRNKHEVER
eukprot:11295843-Heterocapsa_arctica.AAC.1